MAKRTTVASHNGDAVVKYEDVLVDAETMREDLNKIRNCHRPTSRCCRRLAVAIVVVIVVIVVGEEYCYYTTIKNSRRRVVFV